MSTTPATPAPPAPSQETKPSWLTTEFWLMLVAQLVLSLDTFHVWTFIHPPWVALIVQGAVLGAYSLSRGWAKSGTPYYGKGK